MDLWIHYPSKFYPILDKRVRETVEEQGGKWFGSGMSLKQSCDCDDGRDNSFTFKVDSEFEDALDALEKEFSVKHMRTTIQSDNNNLHSYHYMITPTK